MTVHEFHLGFPLCWCLGLWLAISYYSTFRSWEKFGPLFFFRDFFFCHIFFFFYLGLCFLRTGFKLLLLTVFNGFHLFFSLFSVSDFEIGIFLY